MGIIGLAGVVTWAVKDGSEGNLPFPPGLKEITAEMQPVPQSAATRNPGWEEGLQGGSFLGVIRFDLVGL